jgi:hypothetical protein
VTSDLEEWGEFSYCLFTIVFQDKQGAENLHAQTSGGDRRDRNKDLYSSVLAVSMTIKVGLTKVRNQAKPLNILEKKLYFLPT